MLYSIGEDYSANCHIRVSKSEHTTQNALSRVSLYSDIEPEDPNFAY